MDLPFPANAGMIRPSRFGVQMPLTLPRERGDDPITLQGMPDATSPSPRTQG